MKNKINFSSHSGNILNNNRLDNLKSNYNSFNVNNPPRNNNLNINNNNIKNRSSKTPENRIKKSKSNEKINNTQEKIVSNNYLRSSDFSNAIGNDLIFNINDDFQTLVYKNTKLRELIVRANESIVYLVILILFFNNLLFYIFKYYLFR